MMLLMKNWDDIRYFLAVARTGSLSAAARRLGVEHTTVSRRIDQMEKALNQVLFLRQQRGYLLTEAGDRLLSHAESMETSSLALINELSDETTGAMGTVRLATPEALGSQFLSHHWAAFRRLHPGIELELIAETRALSLNRREADVAIMLARPERGRLVALKAGTYRMKLYAAPAYLKDHPPIHRLRDTEGHTVIGYIDDLMPIGRLKFLDQTLVKPNVVFRSTNVTAQMNACIDGLGLALLPCFMGDSVSTLVRVLDERVEITNDLWLATHEDTRSLARIDALMSFLSHLLKREQKRLLGT